MAMHKSKKTRRFQPGGLVTTDGKPVLDGSGQPIMTGSFPEEDEITARGRAKNAAMFKSLVNRVTGREKSAQDETKKEAEMEAAREKLGREAQAYVKDKGDADRLSYEAEQGAKAPRKFSDGDVDESDRRREAAASAPSRATTSSSSSGTKPVTSGTKPKTSAPAVSSSYRSEGAGRAKPVAPSSRTVPAASAKSPGTVLPINPSTLRQREEAEKKRDAARAAKRKESEAKEKKFTKDLSSDPGQVALKKKREEEDKMSPAERSAARGKAIKDFSIKDFFGLKKGGSVSSASKRADGIAQRGKTRGKVY